MDGTWVAGTVKWTSAEMPSWEAVGLFYKQGWQHLEWVHEGPRRLPEHLYAATPPADEEHEKPISDPSGCYGATGINSCSAICWQGDLGQIMRSLCSS